jgi:EPS-associated MarR family transcriptional regulator
MLDEQTRYRLLKLLEANPELSQRQLAQALGVSVGKTNFCLNALIGRGLVKARNFRNSRNKLAYMYFLTPAGFEEKARVSIHYLKLKLREYEALKSEIEELQLEARRLNEPGDDALGDEEVCR